MLMEEVLYKMFTVKEAHQDATTPPQNLDNSGQVDDIIDFFMEDVDEAEQDEPEKDQQDQDAQVICVIINYAQKGHNCPCHFM